MRLSGALAQVVRDRERKSLGRIVLEVLKYTLTKRELPSPYFNSLLYHIDAGDSRDYLSHRQLRRITHDLFDVKSDYRPFNDKLLFNELVASRNMPTPRILARSDNRSIILDSQTVEVNDSEDLQSAVTSILDQEACDEIFAKPMAGRGGLKAFKLFRNGSEGDIIELHRLLGSTNFLFQESIRQHRKISEIYSRSVNTIRVHSYMDQNSGQVEIISALMRFGTGNSVVDNGAIFVPIDLLTWKLRGNGKSLFENGARTLTTHPDSGRIFKGFQIPYGTEVPVLVKKMSRLFRRPFAAWDIAVTPEGPTVVEGNQTCHLTMAQIAVRGLRTHQGFMSAFQNYL